MKKLLPLAATLVSFILISCKSSQPFTIVSYKNYSIRESLPDSLLYAQLGVYNSTVFEYLRKPIGFAMYSITKKQPEGPLGNLMADAMRWAAEKQFCKKVDAAFINHGSIRHYIPKGNITINTVYQLMPYDNSIVLQEIKGELLQKYLDHIASKGGWPMSGITMEISNKKAVNIKINNHPLDVNTRYTIANSDYVANGGDNTHMLRYIPRQNNNYLLRDGIIEYFEYLSSRGLPISAKLENRIVNDE